MRQRTARISILLLLLAAPSHAFAARGPPLPRLSATTIVALRTSESASKNEPELKEYKDQASALFGNLRIPASLFAGAAAASAFSLPVSHDAEPFRVGLVKRIYALLMMGALGSEIVAVVVSTLAVATLSTIPCPKTTCTEDLLREHYALEWVSARFHFLSGLLMFLVGIGIRAWINIACSVIAKAALGIVLSSAMLCFAFIQELEQACTITDGLHWLPFRYLQLMWRESKKRPLFALALLMSMLTNLYIFGKAPHVVHWLKVNQGP